MLVIMHALYYLLVGGSRDTLEVSLENGLLECSKGLQGDLFGSSGSRTHAEMGFGVGVPTSKKSVKKLYGTGPKSKHIPQATAGGPNLSPFEMRAASRSTRSASSALLHFFSGEGSRTKVDNRKKLVPLF